MKPSPLEAGYIEQKNQENPQDAQLKRLKSPGFYDPHTMTREGLEKAIAAARVDLCRNLSDTYRLELAQWLEAAEGVRSMDTLEPNDLTQPKRPTPDPQDLLGSRASFEVFQGLVYEVTPGHAEGWECVTLERTVQGVKVVICQGHAQYKLEPTAFVLQGLLSTVKRIARGELAHAELGRVGWQALEVTARRNQVIA